jgi:XTP/dITP diphosphohydrolase
MTIWFASGNANKKKELAEILSAEMAGLELKIPSDAGLDFGPEETANSFLGNAFIKAASLHRLLTEKGLLQQGDAIISDDSGICADALGGRPGVHSAYYGAPGTTASCKCGCEDEEHEDEEHGNERHSHTPLTAKEQNDLLLKELGENPFRSGRFVCAMILYYSAERFFIAQETLEGEIVKEARGQGGFGYDPVLYIPALGRTVAELDAEEKNLYSHRGKAARAIARILSEKIAHEKKLSGKASAGA